MDERELYMRVLGLAAPWDVEAVELKEAQGRVPHGTCQSIFDTGELLVRAISDAVSPEDLARLQELLRGPGRLRSSTTP